MQARLYCAMCFLFFVLTLANCGNPKEEARIKLGKMNVEYSQDSFVEKARDGDLIPVRLFLQSGMDPNVTNKIGQTALIVGARYGREEILSLLLEKGADPDVKDVEFGATPLIWASKTGFKSIVKKLLDNGADINSRNNDDRTPLLWAAYSGHSVTVQLLLGRGKEVGI